jgi:hypothetical protein
MVSDEQLKASPFNLEEDEVSTLRICLDKATGADQRADDEMRKFLNLNVLTSFIEKFETYGVTNLTDLCDPGIVSDADLKGRYFQMDDFKVLLAR